MLKIVSGAAFIGFLFVGGLKIILIVGGFLVPFLLIAVVKALFK